MTTPRVTTGGTLLECLARGRLFQQVEPNVLESLALGSRVRSYRAGDYLLRQGDPGTHVILIQEGHVSILRRGSEGSVRLAERRANETIGELAILDGRPRMADAVAAEPTSAIVIDGAVFGQALQRSTVLLHRLATCGAERQREAADAMERLVHQRSSERLASTLLYLIECHGLERTDAGVSQIAVSLTLQELSDHAGVCRITISRQLGSLRRRGIASLGHGRVAILDIERLVAAGALRSLDVYPGNVSKC